MGAFRHARRRSARRQADVPRRSRVASVHRHGRITGAVRRVSRALTGTMRAVIFAGAWAACAGIAPASAAASFAPANWDAGLRLTEYRDTNPEPTFVESY